MKSLLALAILTFASVSSASIPAPNGTYTGKGKLIRFMDGGSFAYDVSYTIADNAITANYTYPSGYKYSLPMVLEETTLGQFNIKMENASVGSGYCLGNSCHVDVSFLLSGLIQHVTMELIWAGAKNLSHSAAHPNMIVISGRNSTTDTAFEDVISQ